ARYDNYSDFGSAVSPRVGFVQELTEKVKTKLLYGQAYRAPGFFELYTRNNPVLTGNKDIKAQKVETVEANTLYFPTGNTMASVSIYHNLYRDLILQDNTGKFYNAQDKQRDWGGEAEWRFKRDEYKYVSFNYSYIDPHDTHG